MDILAQGCLRAAKSNQEISVRCSVFCVALESVFCQPHTWRTMASRKKGRQPMSSVACHDGFSPRYPPRLLPLPSQPVLCHSMKNSQFCSPWTLYNSPKFWLSSLLASLGETPCPPSPLPAERAWWVLGERLGSSLFSALSLDLGFPGKQQTRAGLSQTERQWLIKEPGNQGGGLMASGADE